MKHPIILDACTIINLLRIDEDEFLFKSIKSMDLHIANIVYQEVCSNVKKNSLSKEQKKYIQQIIPLFLSYSRQDADIINDLQEYFDKLTRFTAHTKKRNGELLSSALSLCVSREKSQKVHFYTDDFPAKEQFSRYFSYQQIGEVGDSVDLLIFLYWTKSDFSIEQLLRYLNDLKSEFNIPLKNLVNKIQTKKDLLTKKDKKEKSLIENIDNILYGYLNADMQLLNTGIVFFLEHKKFTAIKNIIQQFPNIEKECILFQKVRNTIQSLSSYEIFKIA